MTNDERDKMLQETHDAATRMEAAWEGYRKLVDELARTVKGHNGRPGLATRVVKLEMVAFGFGASLALTLVGAGIYWVFSKL